MAFSCTVVSTFTQRTSFVVTAHGLGRFNGLREQVLQPRLTRSITPAREGTRITGQPSLEIHVAGEVLLGFKKFSNS